jgi:UDP-GlcNAc3NAcA epimerase
VKIVTIVGACPQFIKAASVSRAIQKHNEEHQVQIRELMVHTGQHYDENMSQVFFDELEIREPDYNLGVGSGSHGKMTGMMLEKIEEVLLEERPDAVFVYGDTNSNFASALAAPKLHIQVGHVEAGNCLSL